MALEVGLDAPFDNMCGAEKAANGSYINGSVLDLSAPPGEVGRSSISEGEVTSHD
jgi:hypothetical protein